MSWKESWFWNTEGGVRNDMEKNRGSLEGSRKIWGSLWGPWALTPPPPPREVWRQIQLQLRNTSQWGASAFYEKAAERMRTRMEQWRQPSPSPKPLMTGKLMEIFLLRDMMVNKGIQKSPALPLGKFIHNLTVRYFNWEQRASAEFKSSGKRGSLSKVIFNWSLTWKYPSMAPRAAVSALLWDGQKWDGLLEGCPSQLHISFHCLVFKRGSKKAFQVRGKSFHADCRAQE